MSQKEWKSLEKVHCEIYSVVGDFYNPKTTRQIQQDLKKNGIDLHWQTVNKRLETMAKNGGINKLQNGFNFWVRSTDKND